MNTFWQVLYLVLWFWRWLLLARLVFEVVRMIARRWVPAGVGAIALEFLYVTTDPPIRALRKIIPTVRLGGVGFDLSVMVLLIVTVILLNVIESAAWRTLL